MNDRATSLYDFSFLLPSGQELPLSQFQGRVVMIVNIATQCGFTKQLDDMEKLQSLYKDKPFVLIGVPSNDFRGQTPEEDLEVEKFCQMRFHTHFIVTQKVHVKGDSDSIHPFFLYLRKLRRNSNIKWNFEKFLFDKNGQYVDYFSTLRSPTSKKIMTLLNRLIP